MRTTTVVDTKNQPGVRSGSPAELRKALNEAEYDGPMWFLFFAALDLSGGGNGVRWHFELEKGGMCSDYELLSGPGSQHRVTASVEGHGSIIGAYWETSVEIWKDQYGFLHVAGVITDKEDRCTVLAADGTVYEFDHGILQALLLIHAVDTSELRDAGAHLMGPWLGRQPEPLSYEDWLSEMLSREHRTIAMPTHESTDHRDRELEQQDFWTSLFMTKSERFDGPKGSQFVVIDSDTVVRRVWVKAGDYAWAWRYFGMSRGSLVQFGEFDQKAALLAAMEASCSASES